ncbi:MAG: hypothetical protein H0V01_09750 [Bacteroidetes bacterium]|nr:hypothetical protein [Bacteroidota bacterium]HET6243130.1 hypothetical protein [Bacteroidia bacterium]
MEVYIHFKEVNSDFSKQIADQFFEGKESEDNIKYSWEDEVKITEDVVDFKIINRAVYNLKGNFADDKAFSFDIPDMTICESKTISGNIVQFAVSGKLIKQTEKRYDNQKEIMHFYFYLFDRFPVKNPFPGVYILAKHFPEELK